MEWVETTGRTVADALDAGLDRLGVDEDEAEYEVLEEGRAGFLGRREARIRARVRPISREKPGERRRRSRRGRDGASDRPAKAPVAVGGTGRSGGNQGSRPRRRRGGSGGRTRRPNGSGPPRARTEPTMGGTRSAVSAGKQPT